MAAIERLTGRQKDCLRLVAQGYTSKEIGRRLSISPATVDNHIRAALEILQVESRAEAARLLVGSADDQPLTSQPPTIAEPADRAAHPEPVEPEPVSWWRAQVPPLGGFRNELNWDDKTYAILRVAGLGFGTLILLTLGISTLLWFLR